MDPIIEFNDFSWKYKSSKHLILNSINLKINQGEFVGIMGPTGAGKSTLCSCINGLIPLRTRGWIKGTVNVFNINTRNAKMNELANKAGLVFQDPETQFIMMTVEDEIAIGLETLNLDRSEMKERIDWALNLVGLKEFTQKSPDELSGGQKQRVAIASVMAMRPEILILDEPTSDLDPYGKREVFELLERIRKKFNLTIILVSHETDKILTFCDRIVLLAGGEIMFNGSPSEFLTQEELIDKLGIYNPSKAHKEFIKPEFNKKEHVFLQKKPVIEISNLSFSYPNQTQALTDITFNINYGDFIAIIGKNGSGKTTLIKHFNGLLKPQIGEIRLQSKSIKEYEIDQIAQTIGFCYQNPDHQLFKNTIKEEIEFGLQNLKFPKEEIENRYKEISQLLDLNKFEEDYEST
ncbi:MAG: ABC transporter ATP-binding protein, partial [Candidatus Hodarchaeota archaeon]